MKKLNFLFALAITMLMVQVSCASDWSSARKGNGHVVKENREVSSFDGVKASAGINVYLFEGDDEKVVVEADDNLLDCIKTEVKGSSLNCYIDGNIHFSTKMNVYVNYKKLHRVHASSGSDVYGETVIRTDKLDVNVSSGADVKLEIDASDVRCDVSSGSGALLKGAAVNFEGIASSGADIKGADLKVKTCKAVASSAGDIKITVTESIDANASSGGDIVYYGHPEREYVNESSGGDVKRK